MLKCIETAKRELANEQNKMKEKLFNNSTKNKSTSMKELRERENIIIIKASKSSTVVIMDAKDFFKGAERQLNNTDNYRKLKKDPTTNMTLVNNTIKEFKKQILVNHKVAEGLTQDIEISSKT